MISPWIEYSRERLPLRLFAPVVLLLTLAACWASKATDAKAWVQGAMFMTLLVVQFRLWDDLCDRDFDQLNHPDRVLTRVDPRPFFWTTVLLAVAGSAFAWFFGAQVSFSALVGLNLTFVLLYFWIRPHLHETAWRYIALLSKYPTFIAVVAFAIGTPSPPRLFWAMLLTYAAAQVYEALHDGSGKSTSFHREKTEPNKLSL